MPTREDGPHHVLHASAYTASIMKMWFLIQNLFKFVLKIHALFKQTYADQALHSFDHFAQLICSYTIFY